ncbi:hypothetical protein [Streptomyces sp. CBMA123]|uniref:hypothetical protein n=1 Tax=Streptomyces sp. CBMA123 TaxID=1896313 RepID=UPI001661B582|nr:hypothetical protein [Streptomyces sp. CBMA123]MBD0695446.1 hypothetical protein [Streptomyces sp. CBMA123]
MGRLFGPLTYTSEESAEECEAAAATESGAERLESLGHAALSWTAAGAYPRGLALLDEVAAARREGVPAGGGPELDWLLPLYAFNLFTAGRTEEAWATVEAAEAYARGSGGSSAFDQLADYLADAGHLEPAVGYWTAALDLLLHGEDPHPAVAYGPGPEHAPVHRIRAHRRRVREQLGLPADEHDLALSPRPRRSLVGRLFGRGSARAGS